MKETGIIMSGNHPNLIIDGLKTMTRRTYGLEIINLHPEAWHVVWNEGDLWAFSNEAEEETLTLKCPYGQVGDRLWVRETWRPAWAVNLGGISGPGIQYKSDMVILGRVEAGKEYPECQFHPKKWHPSLFMNRWASRITREITTLRAERLQDITEEDAEAEGVGCCPDSAYTDYRHHFMVLWDSLNAKRGYPFDFNPWVWPISFSNIPKDN